MSCVLPGLETVIFVSLNFIRYFICDCAKREREKKKKERKKERKKEKKKKEKKERVYQIPEVSTSLCVLLCFNLIGVLS